MAVAAVCAGAAAQSGLVMRASARPPAGEVASCELQGVVITGTATGAGSAQVVSWDQIVSVSGDLADEAAPFLVLGEEMWRARTRLARGDVLGAEPLFEALYPRFAGQRGPSSAVVCGGLFRCRLAVGAQTSSVGPWLAYVNAVSDGDSTTLAMPDREPGSIPALDGVTHLAPMLPPVWVNLASVQSLARGPWPLAEDAADTRPKAAALQRWYTLAARFEAGLGASPPAARSERDEGLALVRDVVLARIGDDSQRSAGRTALQTRLAKTSTPWVEVWCHVGIGRSLLRESDRESQLLGVAELLEVAARLERVNPYLTGIAMAESAVALHKLGDSAGAGRVRQEFLDRLPGHPAGEWDALRTWSAAGPPTPKTLPLKSSTDTSNGDPL